VIFCIISNSVYAGSDLGVSVLGDEVEDTLSKMETKDESPHLENSNEHIIENLKAEGPSPILPDIVEETVPQIKNNRFKDSGFTLPGDFENQKNYMDLDKGNYADIVKDQGRSAINFIWINDLYNYNFPNNLYANMMNGGQGHFHSGLLLFRSDHFFYKSFLTNIHWSIGGGFAVNYAKGLFIDGTRSDAQFRLYEVPLDLGVGFEVPVSKWFKLSTTFGPSMLSIIQNRSDLTDHETGKNKAQFGFGGFLEAELKLNVFGFWKKDSFEMFTSSGITNFYLNLEGRYHSYQKFLDPIKVSGASWGLGVTFEFL
jgi:hypothetical protein